MTLGAKMFDRYITPVFLALDVVAALGLAGAVRFAVVGLKRIWRPRFGVEASTDSSGHRARPAKASTPGDDLNVNGSSPDLLFGVGLAAVLLLHGLFAFSHHPYYFTYYNPLVGGSRTAPDVLFIGWGEGLDAAAGWLKQQPEARRVISWYSDGPLSYYLRPDQKALSFYFTSYLLEADYVVLYAESMAARPCLRPSWSTIFSAQKPAHIVRSGGLELARVYDVRNQPPPEFVNIDTSNATDFGERMRLAAYRLAQASVSAGDRVPVTLYLKKLAETRCRLQHAPAPGRAGWRRGLAR